VVVESSKENPSFIFAKPRISLSESFLEKLTQLSPDQIRRGIEWLKLKELAIVNESKNINFSLGKNGLESFQKGLPERRLLDLIKNEKFDVILLDMSMPEFSGIDIIDTLDREEILEEQKIIIFSAISHTSNQINGFLKREGIHSCLKKPVELDKLLTAVTC